MSEPVRKLTDGELREAQGTPGLTRRTAFEGDGHWFGHVEAAPVTMSGWHHHGDNVTMGYVLKGKYHLGVRSGWEPEGRGRRGRVLRGPQEDRAS
jgi:hypothetical protein